MGGGVRDGGNERPLQGTICGAAVGRLALCTVTYPTECHIISIPYAYSSFCCMCGALVDGRRLPVSLPTLQPPHQPRIAHERNPLRIGCSSRWTSNTALQDAAMVDHLTWPPDPYSHTRAQCWSTPESATVSLPWPSNQPVSNCSDCVGSVAVGGGWSGPSCYSSSAPCC